MRTLLIIPFAILGVTLAFIFLPENVSAQMESMTIEGINDPYVNSVFNISVDVEGVSRASGGIFRTVMTLFEKDSGQEILAVPDYLRRGINTIQINMIPNGNVEPLKAGVTYVLQIQHVNIISQHEFTPISYSGIVTKTTVELNDSVTMNFSTDIEPDQNQVTYELRSDAIEIDQNQIIYELRSDGIVVLHYPDGHKLYKATMEDGMTTSDTIR